MIAAPLLSAGFMGWALGSNDSANAFGTAVAARIISFRSAAILCSIMILLGAWLYGEPGIRTYQSLAHQDITTAVIALISSAITVTFMTIIRCPVSASQAAVGSILGIGLATDSVNWTNLYKVLVCWVATPLGSMMIALVLYHLLGAIFTKVPMSLLQRDRLIWGGLVAVGCYGAFAIGANNVANVTGVLSKQLSLSDRQLALYGAAAIALGTMTFSRRVMHTVGTGIFRLDGFTALVAVASMAATVHAFALIGVPVSTSQGIVGAVWGISIMRGGDGLHVSMLGKISLAWVFTPFVALVLASSGYAIFCH